MAVLVEANSVIIRTQVIRERYTGGWNEFAEAVPNGTLDVARVGFMNPDDCESHIASLERRGLTFLRDGQSQNIAVAIHRRHNCPLRLAGVWPDRCCAR